MLSTDFYNKFISFKKSPAHFFAAICLCVSFFMGIALDGLGQRLSDLSVPSNCAGISVIFSAKNRTSNPARLNASSSPTLNAKTLALTSITYNTSNNSSANFFARYNIKAIAATTLNE